MIISTMPDNNVGSHLIDVITVDQGLHDVGTLVPASGYVERSGILWGLEVGNKGAGLGGRGLAVG